MNIKVKEDVGVIIGRFQVNKLHEGHLDLIRSVSKEHKKLLILIGISPTLGTVRNPLDYITREKMLKEAFPQATILPLKDCSSNEEWSSNLDDQIENICPRDTFRLYGGRDSFIDHYKGKHPTAELDLTGSGSGTLVRESISKNVVNSPDFRAGIIYAAYNQFPRCYPCVDVAIIKPIYHNPTYYTHALLLGQKYGEKHWRLPGGFVDPTDFSLEAAAKRELFEETGLSVEGSLNYVNSSIVNDWRFKDVPDKIMTTLFWGYYNFGKPVPGDDLSKCEFFLISELPEIVSEHAKLIEALIKKEIIKL